jgi:uncharacterized Zn finger protein
MLDVSTIICTSCGNPARVPEDVMAVMEQNGKLYPLVVCPNCSTAFIEELKRRMDVEL